MVQKRVKTGKEFEEYICRLYGLSRHMKRPRLFWNGEGRNNVNKIISLNKNPEEFKVILSESKFIKSDAIDKEGNLYEIKKYSKNQLKKYRLYSEPIIKVAPSRSKWGSGDPFFDNFRSAVEYNNFIGDLMETKWWRQYNQIILDSIIYSNRGIYCKDGFLCHDKLEFKWVVNKGEYGPIFDGYYRLSIVFKIKDNSDIEFSPPQPSILEKLKEIFNNLRKNEDETT